MDHLLMITMTEEGLLHHVATVQEVMGGNVLLVLDDHRCMMTITTEGTLVDLPQEENTVHHLRQGDMMILTITGLLHLQQEATILTIGEILMEDLAVLLPLVAMEVATEVVATEDMRIDHTRYAFVDLNSYVPDTDGRTRMISIALSVNVNKPKPTIKSIEQEKPKDCK